MIGSGRARAGRRPGWDRGTPVGIHVAAGSTAVVLAALAAAAVPTWASGVRLAMVALMVAGVAAVALDVVAVVAVTVVAYLVLDGFLINQLGELTWRGGADEWRLLTLASAAGVGLAAGALRRRVRQSRRFAPLEARATAGRAPAAMTTTKEEWHSA